VLGGLIPVGTNVALFDFPNYSNVGDSMIWLGQERYLREVAHARVIAVKDFGNERMRFPRLDPSAIILFQGGGNTGDLWPQFQELREAAVRFYPDNRIIQMPQSIYFENPENFQRARNVYNSHGDFHFMARDEVSLELAKQLHDGESTLCPDMALFLDPMPGTIEPTVDILGLLRDDKEKNPGARSKPTPERIEACDWIEEDITVTMKFAARLRSLQNRAGIESRNFFRLKHLLYNRVARNRLLRGREILSRGKVVVTDRLHAHILCSLMGIPHVVLDNSYGKISGLMRTWETGKGLAETASDINEALDKAEALLA
jgi:pyruvyl transferase EpsO